MSFSSWESSLNREKELIIILKPNTICRNEKCKKLFVSCSYCSKTNNWRSICCSPECYAQYVEQVQIARGLKLPPLSLIANRIDITAKQVEEITAKPVEQVVEIAKKELGEYASLVDEIGFAKTVDKVNEDLRKEQEKANQIISIYQYKTNHFVNSYNSMSELLKNSEADFGIKFSNVGVKAVIEGKQKQHKGYVFKNCRNELYRK